MRKCRIGTAKFFTLLLLLYHTSIKIAGLKLLMRAQTGRDFEITEQQAAGVAVFRFDATAYSAKKRRIG